MLKSIDRNYYDSWSGSKRRDRQGPHLGGDPLFSVSHRERISSDRRIFEARLRLAAGGYSAAAPGEARSRARRLQNLAPLRERAVVRRFDVRAVAGGPLSALVDDGAAEI